MARRSRIALLGSAALVAAVALDMGWRSAARAAPRPDGMEGRTATRATDTMDSLRSCLPGDPVPAGSAVSVAHTVEVAPHLDAQGSLMAWTVDVAPSDDRPWRIRLHPESSVSRPVDGRVVVTEDDGARSVVSILSLDRRCTTVVARTVDVVRSALIRKLDDTVLFHAVDRLSRRDLGVWTVGSADRPPSRMVSPLEPDDPAARAVGRVFLTQLLLDGSSAYVAVQSCGERSCRTRIVDLTRGRETRVEDPDQGLLVSFDQDHADFVDLCDGRVCAHRTVDLELAPATVGRDFSPIPPATEIQR